MERYPLRLNDSQDSYSGELQVYVNGSWGAFCYSNFSDTTAKIVCKTLGFKTAESHYKIDATKTNTQVAVEEVYCNRSIQDFYNCIWKFQNNEVCRDDATVGVVCSNGELQTCSNTMARARNGQYILSHTIITIRKHDKNCVKSDW